MRKERKARPGIRKQTDQRMTMQGKNECEEKGKEEMFVLQLFGLQLIL